MEKKSVTPEQVESYEKLIATHPDIERKGKTMPYTSHNGHMFTVFSSNAELGIRLPKEEREAFIKKYKTTLLASYGTVMKEYVTIPDALLQQTKKLAPYLAMSYEYIKTLKPKPTTRKKKP